MTDLLRQPGNFVSSSFLRTREGVEGTRHAKCKRDHAEGRNFAKDIGGLELQVSARSRPPCMESGSGIVAQRTSPGWFTKGRFAFLEFNIPGFSSAGSEVTPQGILA